MVNRLTNQTTPTGPKVKTPRAGALGSGTMQFQDKVPVRGGAAKPAAAKSAPVKKEFMPFKKFEGSDRSKASSETTNASGDYMSRRLAYAKAKSEHDKAQPKTTAKAAPAKTPGAPAPTRAPPPGYVSAGTVGMPAAPKLGTPAAAPAAGAAIPPAGGGANTPFALGRAAPMVRVNPAKKNSAFKADPTRDANKRFSMLTGGGPTGSAFWKP